MLLAAAAAIGGYPQKWKSYNLPLSGPADSVCRTSRPEKKSMSSTGITYMGMGNHCYG